MIMHDTLLHTPKRALDIFTTGASAHAYTQGGIYDPGMLKSVDFSSLFRFRHKTEEG